MEFGEHSRQPSYSEFLQTGQCFPRDDVGRFEIALANWERQPLTQEIGGESKPGTDHVSARQSAQEALHFQDRERRQHARGFNR